MKPSSIDAAPIKWVLAAAAVSLAITTSTRAALIGTPLYYLAPPSGANGTLDYSNLLSAGAAPAAGGMFVGSFNHSATAVVWNPNGTPVNIQPAGFSTAVPVSTNGTLQVGSGTPTGASSGVALLWNGNASPINLNPSAPINGVTYTGSGAVGISPNGAQQIGDGTTGGAEHAMIWSGTSGSAIDIHPTNLNFTDSYGLATNGTMQVGAGTSPASQPNTHALLWNGTSTATDLHPTAPAFAGLTVSSAQGISASGNQQVGQVGNLQGNITKAVLWNGTAESAVDLQPTNLTGFTQSWANGTNDFQQVGVGEYAPGSPANPHALLWSGTADSAVDLQTLLPGTWFQSFAYTIDASGNVFGIAFGTPSAGGPLGPYAVEWTNVVPEPSTLAGVGLAASLLLARRKRR